MFQLNAAVFGVAMVALFAGDVLMVQGGAGAAAVTNAVWLVLHPVALPPAFFGDTYQLYVVPAVRPVAL